ncbi:hypothetical protein L195_g018250 [Trifolium pratense]|uniref:Uncharacterized protein n=1 Tax=Trifolium pratense TaxID=57577 RepID=A0A2K3MW80_TRIPR|nr:hypothetical protein L195_g018250 [Trifolium pratense]
MPEYGCRKMRHAHERANLVTARGTQRRGRSGACGGIRRWKDNRGALWRISRRYVVVHGGGSH